ncbi:hypothetical protein AB0P21_34270 [Kribbella sp. NPDC056861]|uniref:hypothetical protein n=1 Tax=Kribbella sp. NPDC056861 TaxID=3154857 RepID=UPI003430E5AF
MADVYCRWERRRYQEDEFELGVSGVLVHLGSSPLHTVNGRLVDSGLGLENSYIESPPSEESYLDSSTAEESYLESPPSE